jgi:hypothetical protein
MIMKKRVIHSFLALFFTLTSTTGFSQHIDSMMGIYAERFPTEKIHIHFDRSIYNKEETIWYKTYILSESGLTTLSTHVYVEWFDTTGKMIKQTVAPLFQSTAKGSFDVPADYAGNFIRVKAYTRWMLNDDPAFAYVHDLTINTITPPSTPKPVVFKTRVDVFPEGGSLITGLNMRVAFKATNQFGTPISIKGNLINSKNKALDSLVVARDGMGSFYFIPVAGETYQLKWTDANGKTGITNIEAPKIMGASIAITRTNENALLKIERTINTTDNFKNMNLLVHMNRNLLYKINLNATEKTLLKAEIPIYELPTGILQFSLFTSDWIPVAERIIYINNRLHEFSAKVTPQLTTLTKRGKNVFDIMVSDTAFTNMSVSVTDASIETSADNTIYSDLMLSGDIKGKINNPGYYLSGDSDGITANLDLVMLTNGWRKYDWEKIKKGIVPELKYPAESELMKITGKVYGLKSISIPNDVLLNLIVQNKDSSRNIFFVPVEKDGSFEQNGILIFDTARIFHSFNQNPTLNSLAQIQFENGLLRQTAKSITYLDQDKPFLWTDSISKAKMNFFLSQQEDWKRRSSYKTLQEVIIKSRVKSKEQLLEEKYATGLFSGGDAFTFNILDDPSAATAMDIFTYLQGKVPGLQISTNGAQTSLNWRGSVPDLFVNEISSNIDLLRNVSVRDIALIKVFRPPFFGAMGGGSGGAIAIYTRKGGDFNSNSATGKGMANTILTGYSKFKEFYNPQYDNPAENPESDIRTTLYWNPYIITNKKNPRIRIQFFNNDLTKKFQVVLEGINADGKMTRVVKLLDGISE